VKSQHFEVVTSIVVSKWMSESRRRMAPTCGLMRRDVSATVAESWNCNSEECETNRQAQRWDTDQPHIVRKVLLSVST
jgi:hypothetical protein